MSLHALSGIRIEVTLESINWISKDESGINPFNCELISMDEMKSF